MRELLDQIASILKEEDDFLITAHVNPDGDAAGSMSAMAWLLTRFGKRVAVYNESGIPNYLDWVTFPCEVHTDLATLPFAPRRIIVLDSGDAARTGEAMEKFLAGKPSIQLDHHLGNPNFAEVNWVDPKCAAVGEMVAILAGHMEQELTAEIGEACYLAMMTDTGHFAFGNTSPRVMELAAEILRKGLDLEAFTARFEATWSLERMRLWGRLYSEVQLHFDGTVASIALPDALFEETGTTLEDTEGFVNALRRIKGVKVAFTVRDAGPGKSKISLRTHGFIDVRAIAASFGGGGHQNAAGATLDKPLKEAVQDTLCAIETALLALGEEK